MKSIGFIDKLEDWSTGTRSVFVPIFDNFYQTIISSRNTKYEKRMTMKTIEDHKAVTTIIINTERVVNVEMSDNVVASGGDSNMESLICVEKIDNVR